jgi:hypothetical protein
MVQDLFQYFDQAYIYIYIYIYEGIQETRTLELIQETDLT